MERFYATSNRLLLVAPLDVLTAFEDISELLARAEEYDREWERRCRAARAIGSSEPVERPSERRSVPGNNPARLHELASAPQR